MIIDPDGLFGGRRMRQLSSMARLRWPHYIVASNGFGRIRLDPHEVVTTVFAGYTPAITEEDFVSDITEYRNCYLLFVYEAGSEIWGQWDTPDRLLPRYKNAKDHASPAPDNKKLSDWKNEYLRQFNKNLRKLLQTSDENSRIDKSQQKVSQSSVEKRESAKVCAREGLRGVVLRGVERGCVDSDSELSAAASCSPSSEYRLEDFPKAAAAIRGKFPTTDDKTILEIIERSLVDKRFSDANLADCLKVETKKTQESAGLYLKTIPLAMTRWAEKEWGSDWGK